MVGEERIGKFVRNKKIYFPLPAFSLSHSLHLPINLLPIKINLRTFLARGENSRTSPRGKNC